MFRKIGRTPGVLAAILLALGIAAAALSGRFSPVEAHEPIFGIGPHVVFRGGIGIETEIEMERASGAGEVERDVVLHTEILYGVTEDFAVTLAVPSVLRREYEIGAGLESSSGLGDVSLRAKYRFWRHDSPGTQDSAALVFGAKLPTGDAGADPGRARCA